jgi:hypothetical protein
MIPQSSERQRKDVPCAWAMRPEFQHLFATSLALGTHDVYAARELPMLPSPVLASEKVWVRGEPVAIVLQRHDFKQRLAVEMRNLVPGVVSYIHAGTGVGKSTIIPGLLAKRLGSIGIIVVPDSGLCGHVSSYVRKLVSRSDTTGITDVNIVTNADDLATLRGAGLVYMNSTDFLIMLVSKYDLFKKSKVGFVFFDEFHEKTPQNYVLRWLIDADKFKHLVVLLGSATAGIASLELRLQEERKLDVHYYPREELECISMHNVGVASPYHHSRIQGNTLIFCASDIRYPVLQQYYDSYGIRVIALYDNSTAKEIADVVVMLEGYNKCVCLVTPKYQTGYTFNVSRVIDCGTYMELSVDLDTRSIKYVESLAPKNDCVQRCGRAGRMVDGKAVTVADNETKSGVVIPGSEMYAVLWLRLFNLVVAVDASMVPYQAIVDIMSYNKVWLLLKSSVHPLIMMNYVDDDFGVVAGTVNLVAGLCGVSKSMLHVVVETVGMATEDWSLYRCVFDDVEYEYKSFLSLPGELEAIGLVFYSAMLDLSMNIDNKSVITGGTRKDNGIRHKNLVTTSTSSSRHSVAVPTYRSRPSNDSRNRGEGSASEMRSSPLRNAGGRVYNGSDDNRSVASAARVRNRERGTHTGSVSSLGLCTNDNNSEIDIVRDSGDRGHRRSANAGVNDRSTNKAESSRTVERSIAKVSNLMRRQTTVGSSGVSDAGDVITRGVDNMRFTDHGMYSGYDEEFGQPLVGNARHALAEILHHKVTTDSTRRLDRSVASDVSKYVHIAVKVSQLRLDSGSNILPNNDLAAASYLCDTYVHSETYAKAARSLVKTSRFTVDMATDIHVWIAACYAWAQLKIDNDVAIAARNNKFTPSIYADNLISNVEIKLGNLMVALRALEAAGRTFCYQSAIPSGFKKTSKRLHK